MWALAMCTCRACVEGVARNTIKSLSHAFTHKLSFLLSFSREEEIFAGPLDLPFHPRGMLFGRGCEASLKKYSKELGDSKKRLNKSRLCHRSHCCSAWHLSNETQP